VLLAFPSHGDSDAAAVQFAPIQVADSFDGFIMVTHPNEAETARLSGLVIAPDPRADYVAVGFKVLHEFGSCDAIA
jgi:hypothetical protein